MKTKEDLIFSVVALEGLLKVEGLYDDVLRIMDEYAYSIKIEPESCPHCKKNMEPSSINYACPDCHTILRNVAI